MLVWRLGSYLQYSLNTSWRNLTVFDLGHFVFVMGLNKPGILSLKGQSRFRFTKGTSIWIFFSNLWETFEGVQRPQWLPCGSETSHGALSTCNDLKRFRCSPESLIKQHCHRIVFIFYKRKFLGQLNFFGGFNFKVSEAYYVHCIDVNLACHIWALFLHFYPCLWQDSFV